MKCRMLVVISTLFCCSVLRAEAEPGSETAMLAKHNIQAVVRSDGSVVDRLALSNSANSPATINALLQAGIPGSPEAWLARMMDPTRNGLAAKNPALFAEWLDAVTEPRFMTALATVAMAPDTYAKTLSKAVDPATAHNWAEFADPQIYLRWMAAGFDPRFYQTLFNRMTDSGKLHRWGLFPTSFENPPALAESDKPAVSGQEWLQLSAREAKANPWLPNGVNYRY